MPQITVYGADWCEDTVATRSDLDSLGVKYRYINIEQDAAAQEWVKRHNGGKQKTPTVDVGGQILVEPERQELELALKRNGLIEG
jgi:glutaredoxin